MPTELRRELWNKGKIVGQKAPFKLKEVCDTSAPSTGSSRVGTSAMQFWPR
jgi:hypothetical protein